MTSTKTECPTPSKTKHKSSAEATRWARHPHNRNKKLRAYRCDCGMWHLTSDMGRKRRRR